MQEFKGSELLKTMQGTLDEIAAEPMSDDATHRVIGRLPVRGTVVKLNGLEFVVQSMSAKQGTLHLKIRERK